MVELHCDQHGHDRAKNRLKKANDPRAQDYEKALRALIEDKKKAQIKHGAPRNASRFLETRAPQPVQGSASHAGGDADAAAAAKLSAYRRQCCKYAASCAPTRSTTLLQSHDGASSDCDRLSWSSANHSALSDVLSCHACPCPTTRAKNSAISLASSCDNRSISSFKSWGSNSLMKTSFPSKRDETIRPPRNGRDYARP